MVEPSMTSSTPSSSSSSSSIGSDLAPFPCHASPSYSCRGHTPSSFHSSCCRATPPPQQTRSLLLMQAGVTFLVKAWPVLEHNMLVSTAFLIHM